MKKRRSAAQRRAVEKLVAGNRERAEARKLAKAQSFRGHAPTEELEAILDGEEEAEDESPAYLLSGLAMSLGDALTSPTSEDLQASLTMALLTVQRLRRLAHAGTAQE